MVYLKSLVKVSYFFVDKNVTPKGEMREGSEIRSKRNKYFLNGLKSEMQ